MKFLFNYGVLNVAPSNSDGKSLNVRIIICRSLSVLYQIILHDPSFTASNIPKQVVFSLHFLGHEKKWLKAIQSFTAWVTETTSFSSCLAFFLILLINFWCQVLLFLVDVSCFCFLRFFSGFFESVESVIINSSVIILKGSGSGRGLIWIYSTTVVCREWEK
jgi:hypothetical protein